MNLQMPLLALVDPLLPPGVFLFASIGWLSAPLERRKYEWLMVCSAFTFSAPRICETITWKLSHVVPRKLDLYAFCFDQAFGSPSFAAGRLLARHPTLHVLCAAAYNDISCAVLALLAFYLWRQTESCFLIVLRAFALDLCLAVPIYLLFPVCGPAYAFPGFPFREPQYIPLRAISIFAPPNGVPSVHMSMALLLLFFAWKWKAVRAAAVIYLVFIVFSTLGSGEHYLFDLIVAVPYSALILYLSGSFRVAVEHNI